MSYDFPAHESTRKRRRWGCTCGCVILLVLLAVAATGLFVIGLKSHQPFPRYAMMDQETDGFGVIRLSPDDQGVQEFTQFLVRRLESYQKQGSGPAQAKALGVLRKVSSNFLGTFIQPESMVYTSYNPATADENYLLTMPLKNSAAWFGLRQFIHSNGATTPVAKQGSAEIYALPAPSGSSSTGTLLSLDPKDVVLSDNQALLFKGLSYASTAGHDGAPSPALLKFVEELDLDNAPDGEDLSLALVNEESRLTNMITVFEDFTGLDGLTDRVAAALNSQQMSFSDISGMKLSADLASADLIKGELVLYCATADKATRLTKVFQTALTDFTGKKAGSPLELKGSAATRGVTVAVAVELSGLKGWVEGMLPVQATPAAPAATPAAQ